MLGREVWGFWKDEKNQDKSTGTKAKLNQKRMLKQAMVSKENEF